MSDDILKIHGITQYKKIEFPENLIKKEPTLKELAEEYITKPLNNPEIGLNGDNRDSLSRLSPNSITSFSTNKSAVENGTHYSFSLNKNGSVILESVFSGVWAGLNPPPVSREEIIPAGTKKEDAIKLLQDKLGITKEHSQEFYSKMEEEASGKAVGSKYNSTSEKPSISGKDNPHIVLQSGDSISKIYNSIPNGQRPKFEQFTKEFMELNSHVINPEKVYAGKDYALPSQYRYAGLEKEGRLINPDVANLAKEAINEKGNMRSEYTYQQTPLALKAEKTGSIKL